MERWDAIVIGGGPAGAAAGRAMAEAGIRVLVLERGGFGRDQACGEGLLPLGVTALEAAGLSRLLAGAPCFGGIRFHVDGRVVVGSFARGLGSGVRRTRFDAELVMAAAAAGAEVRFGAQAVRVEPEAAAGGDGWRVVVRTVIPERLGPRTETLAARVVVLADGARSPLARSLGLGGRASGRVALVGHVAASWAPWVDLHFERGFELALTPVPGGELSVTALVERWRARELGGGAAAWLRERLGELGLSAIAPDEVRAVPVGVSARPAARRRDTGRLAALGAPALLIGDAAGAVDPIVGCGLSIALASAPAVARSVLGLLGGEGSGALRHYLDELRRLERLPRLAIEGCRSTGGASLVPARRRRLAAAVARLVPERAIDLLVSTVSDSA